MYKQSAPLHFSGLVTLFKRISEASSVMISVVKCMWNFLESNTCASCDRKKNFISPKLEHFFVCHKLQFLPKKRSSLSRCINANTKSRAGNKKIFKIKAIFTVIFKEIRGKGGHGNPHLFPVNQILNLKIKYRT